MLVRKSCGSRSTNGWRGELQAPLLVCNEGHLFNLCAEAVVNVAEKTRQIGVQPATELPELIARKAPPAVPIHGGTGGHSPWRRRAAAGAAGRPGDRRCVRLPCRGEHWMPAVSAGQLVRFRIVPAVPETSGGSFEPAELLQAANGAAQQPVQIACFVEKLNRATAERLLATGRFPFNRTMVLLKASAILFEIESLVPDVVSACRAALDPHSAEHECQRLARDAVSACPTMAIDVAVMEKTNRVTVLPLKACWSDGGSWITLWEMADHDDDDNVLRDLKIQEASRNCHLRSESRRVVALGVDNLVVVGTDPVVMVSHRDRNYLMSIVSQLESKEARESKALRKFYRLWGSDDGHTEGERRQVKKVVVNLGANLSLVMHQNRAVHWIVMASKTVLEKDVGQELVSEEQNSYITLGALHRLSNSGKISVEMINVQSGPSPGEDEIASSEERLVKSRMMSFDKQTACICNNQSRFLLRGRNYS